MVFTLASRASAQIITTMMPGDVSQSGGERRAPAIHVMVGYAAWDYGSDFFDQVAIDLRGGTIDGVSRSGMIVAADLPFKVGSSVNMTIGGWYNNGGTRTVHDPQHQYHGLAGEVNVFVPDRVFRDRSQFSSLYASVLYKWVGVQAGIVPVQISQTLDVAGQGSTGSDRSQMDVDAFGVFHYTDTDMLRPIPITFTIGIGAYGYSARDGNLLENGFFDAGSATPASIAPSGFGIISAALTRHVAFDFSVWLTGANNTRLKDSQNRATVGLGITF